MISHHYFLIITSIYDAGVINVRGFFRNKYIKFFTVLKGFLVIDKHTDYL